eukprot:352854-Chlamydomonas_euryale.AAC.10
MRSKTYTKQTAQANVKGNTHRENVQKSTRRENAQGKCAGTTKIRTNPTRFPNTCTLPSEPNLTWLPAHASQTNASLRPHSLRQVLLMTSDEVAELEAEYVAHGGEAAEAAAAAVTAARMGGSGAATGAGGRGSKARRQDKQGVSEAAPAAGAAGSPGGGGGGGGGGDGDEAEPLSLGTELLEEDEGFAQVVAMALIQVRENERSTLPSALGKVAGC